MIVLLVFSPVINLLYYPLDVPPRLEKADAILLLSAEAYDDDILGRCSYQRMHKAFKLYKEKYAPVILVSGGVPFEAGKHLQKSRAEIIKNHLQSMGVPENSIYLEDQSQNTYENLLFADAIGKKNGWRKYLLVTSGYHMFRSLKTAAKLGIIVSPMPVINYEKDINHFVIRARFVLDILREYAAIVYFKLRGWI